MATQDDYIRTALRVPPKLHAKIHESAKESNRTFNAEIVARLERSFADAPPELKSSTPEAVHLRDELVALIERKRKNQEVVDYLKEAGLPFHQVAEAFERELHDIGYKAHTAAQRLIELGEVDAVKQSSKRSSKKI